jgi:hypothetical protein
MIKSRWLLVAVMGLPLLGCSKDTAKSTAAVQLPPLAIAANRPALEVIAGDGQLGAADYGETRQCTARVNRTGADLPGYVALDA